MAAGPGHAGISWRAWPLRRRPARGVLAAVICAGTVVGVWSWTGSRALTALSVVVLAAATAPFFLPTTFAVGPGGVEVARLGRRRTRPWSDFRAVRGSGDLLVLSPYARPSWLDGLRGETLFPEGNGAEVRDYVEEMVGQTPGSDGE